MDVDDAFDTYQGEVNADPGQVAEARKRRDVFWAALEAEADVAEIVPSGSLARGSQRDPIHDVDLIVVYEPGSHPNWEAEGAGTAEEALDHTRGRVRALLGATEGTKARIVRHTLLRNHVVKCFLDPPDDPKAFAVEVMPVFRTSDALRIPERHDDRWTTADPEYLIDAVAKRHASWVVDGRRFFVPMVRVVKAWKDHAELDMKSLVAEVLALHCIPHAEPGTVLRRPEALARFFTAAAAHVMGGVVDPAGWCGEIQPDLDRAAVRARLLEAADVAGRALEAQRRGEHAAAICLWREVFGDAFPEPLGGCPGSGRKTAITAPAFIPRPVKDNPQG
jgi:predicted nucleotidyltransferase